METVAPSTPEAAPALPESFSSPDVAARFLIERRSRGESAPAEETETTSDAGAETAAAGETELSDEGNAAPDENQATGETGDIDPADDLPPIEMPRSWTKAQAEHWKALPRATQEYLSEQASQASAEVRRLQNEAAEKSKVISAKEKAADEARATYEQKARDALNILAREQQRDYADIKTVEDVTKLAATDPLRFIQWQAHQAELAAVKNTVDEADKRKADDDAKAWHKFRQEQNAKAVESIPDLGDKDKAPKIMEKAVALLQDIGFTPEDLGRLDKGEKLSLFDHRVQHLLYDAIQFRDAKATRDAAVKAAVTKPVPPVQRPGARQAGTGQSERIQALTNQFKASGSVKDAAALLAARRNVTRRAS